MKKYTISVDDAQFYIYTPSEKKIWGKVFWIIDFERRHDLLYTPASAGVIVQLNVTNKRYGSTPERGVRHKMKFSLVDTTLKTVVASLTQSIYVPKDEFFKHHYLQFPIDGLITRDIHVFKLVVFDETANCTLGEFFFNVFNEEILGSPAKWYWVSGGGLYPNGGHDPYKWVLPCNESYTEHGIEFDLQPRFGKNLPVILPELEMRIYKPDENYPDTHIVELKKNGCSWWVNRSFLTGNKRGIYYVELTCMGHLIAGVPFGVYDDYANDRWSHAELEAQEKYSPHNQDSVEKAADRFLNMLPKENRLGEDVEVAIEDLEVPQSEENTGESPLETEKEEEVVDIVELLDDLTGLSDVKTKLATYQSLVRFNKMRSNRGLAVPEMPLHAMFLGSPGTGKTTVAKMMGTMLKSAGVLSSGHVVVRERATLLGQYYSSECEKTLAALEEAQGGILFIDEAYQLHQPDDPRDPGKFVIETLLTALADTQNRDWMLILAGYPDEMKRMFEINPGFKSRIPDSNIYTFEDFSEEELLEIAVNYLTRNQYTLLAEAQEALVRRIHTDYSRRGKNFGNARYVMNLIQTEILPAMAVRVMSEPEITPDFLSEIRMQDIPLGAGLQAGISRPRIGFRV